MLRGRTLKSAVLVVCLMLSGAVTGTADEGDPAVVGAWSAPFAENPIYNDRPPQTIEESLELPPAVSMVVLPDGRVLYWGGVEGLEDSAAPLALDAGRSARLSRARVLDLSDPDQPVWRIPSPEVGVADDMFCADQRLLADGRVFIVGGTRWENDPVDLTPLTGPAGPGGTAELFGSEAAQFFDPDVGENGGFTAADPMTYGRWYPTMITLGDGRLFVASGVERLLYNTSGLNVHQTEIFDPDTETWELTGEDGDTTLPLYPRFHLLPDGKVFYPGVGQMWSPFGQAADQALWNLQKTYDPDANEWQVVGYGSFGARSGAISVMLPLEPPYDETRILVAGGTLGTSPGSYAANDITEIITVGDGQASSERAADMNNSRWYSSGILLPDGSVVAVSGATADHVVSPGSEFPVRQAEIFDGTSWRPLSSGSRDRTYHNAAVLLADGRVLVGGHSPINSGYGDKGDNTLHDALGTASNLKDPSFEIFEPPYLHRGPRPVIHSVQRGIAWTETTPSAFPVGVDSADDIEKVVLVRLPSTTHVMDADMRAVELDFEVDGQNLLDVTGPPNGKVAPPGFYYLFVLRDNGQGLTPSTARIVKVGPTPDVGQAIAPMG